MISKDTVYSKIKDAGNIPTLPEVLLKLLSACDNEDTPLSEISEIVSHDPALSAKILQLVNSAYYGFRHSFSSINQAVIYLGANTIKNLAVTMSVHQVFSSKRQQSTGNLQPALFWWQSLMCASTAKHIAEKAGATNSDEAYLGGLLHNIGQLILASTFREEYAAITAQKQLGVDLLALEEQYFGINHSEAGAWLVRTWNLNPLIADAIQYHHAPITLIKEAFPLVKIIYAANQLTQNYMELNYTCDACSDLFRMGQNDLDEIVENGSEEVDAMAASMGIVVYTGFNKKEHRETEKDTTQTAEKTIISRVQNISLLTSFLTELVQANSVDEMFSAFERSINILYNFDKVLFFLPDEKNIFFNGQTSSQNPLHSTCSGLTLPLEKSSSQIAKTYFDPHPKEHLIQAGKDSNLADQQILSIFKSSAALPLRLSIKGKAVGVVLLGLPQESCPLPDHVTNLLGSLVQQLALCLHLEFEKRKRAKELHTERMDAISMTARKFAHEINNPLGIISNYLVGMRFKLPEEHEILGDIGIIDEEIKRISGMVSQMQMFSQAPFSKFEQIDINKLISTLIQLVKSSLFARPDLSLSFIPGSDVPLITTSRDAIKQVLINLLKNAAEAMEDGGRVMVRTKKHSEDEPGANSGVEIIISDTGPGLPDAVKNNLYKPFITTKQNGHSGLGLSIINKIVSDIGGELSCSSTKTKGTTFTIILPITKGATPLSDLT